MRVTLYTKPGCQLCLKAKRLLDELRSEGFKFELEERDITQDSTLYERYRFEIPVIAVDGVERLKGQITPEALRGCLSPRRPA